MTNNHLPIDFLLKSPLYEYKIEEVLGQGAFGITYRATTTVEVEKTIRGPLGTISSKEKVSQPVAIKEFFMHDIVLRSGDGNSISETSKNPLVQNYARKFRKEAENLSHLHHPHIVQVLEVFDANNTTYYVMELIEGTSLEDYIVRKGGLSETETLRIAQQIGEALDYMHGRQLLHLDLKPKNVMLDHKGNVHLIDFGLSKHFNADGEPETSTTIGLGTPGYAPIEQADSNSNSFSATLDIYALGGTMYKMLTGKQPPRSSEVLDNGLPIEELRAKGVSEKTIAMVEKAMEPARRKRYQSIGEMFPSMKKAEAMPPSKEEMEEAPSTIIANPPEASIDEETKVIGKHPEAKEQRLSMDKKSYAVGMGIGQNLLNIGAKDIVVADFAQAISDLLEGRKIAIDYKEAQIIVNQYLNELERVNSFNQKA